MKEAIRLFYFVVIILPLALLFIGPLLTLAALRGRQHMGPIILNPGRRGTLGRVGALLLGVILWSAIWGALAGLLVRFELPASGRSPSEIVKARPTPTGPSLAFSPTPSPRPTFTSTPPVLDTPTPTPEIPTPSPFPTPFPSPSPVPPTATAPLPTATAIPTASVTPTLPPPIPTGLPSPPLTPLATLAPGEATLAITTVEEANELLKAAVIEPSIGNLADMERLWRGDALAKAQAFAQELNQRYAQPLEVTYAYLLPPQVQVGDSSDTANVISSETWTYSGPRSSYGESFEFNYTLLRQDEGWVIVDYTYGNVPITVPLIISPTTITTTPVNTPSGQ